MKVGSIDISIPLMAYIAVLVVGSSMLMTLWSSKKEAREESSARRNSLPAKVGDKYETNHGVLRAMYDDNPDAIALGIENCNSLLKQNPDKVSARLFLGTLLCRKGDKSGDKSAFSESAKAFEEIQKSPSATNEEKAWAFVGQGVAIFKGAAKGKEAEAAEKAEQIFKSALQLPDQANNPDVIANLAVAQVWKNKSDWLNEAGKYCQQALAPDLKRVPSLKAQEELYILQGTVLANTDKFTEAASSFERAVTVNPNAAVSADCRRLSILGYITTKDIDPKTRRQVLLSTEGQIMSYGANTASARNALGYGWFYLKDEPDCGIYIERNLLGAINADRKDPRGYLNIHAYYDYRIMEQASKIGIPVTEFTGETPPVNRWLLKEGEKISHFSVADKRYVIEIRRLLDVQQDYLRQCIQFTSPAKPELIDLKLLQLTCVRRKIFLTEESNTADRTILYKEALALINDIIAINPARAESYFTLGQVYIDENEFMLAYQAYTQAKQKGMKSEQLERNLTMLSAPPVLIDQRPSADHKPHGNLPLIGATMKALVGGEGFKAVQMFIDDKEIKPKVYGTQILYVPTEADLSDGEHSIRVAVTTSLNPVPMNFEPTKMSLDRKPPTCTITPDNTQPLTAKPTWTIVLADHSGVDPMSVSVMLSSGKTMKRPIIENGKYKTSFPEFNVRPGSFVDVEKPIKISLELPAGDWILTVHASDNVGNETTVPKTYSIKGQIKVEP